jgi:hypothetical protein
MGRDDLGSVVHEGPVKGMVNRVVPQELQPRTVPVRHTMHDLVVIEGENVAITELKVSSPLVQYRGGHIVESIPVVLMLVVPIGGLYPV